MESCPLASARGAVREGAQAIDNLLHLLGSRRVGPKAIGGAIVDVRDGCAALRQALGALARELVDLLRADPSASSLAASLLDRAEARVAALASDLEAVKRVDVDARSRLSIEAVVRKASLDLEALLSLVDLLSFAATQRPSELDARDVLQGHAAFPTTKVTLVGDARIVVGLLSLARSIVASAARAEGARAQGSPRVLASPLSGDRLKVLVALDPAPPGASSAASNTPSRDVDARALDPEGSAAALAVARAVARLAGVDLAVAPSGRSVTLVFGAPVKAAERAPGVVERGS